MRVLDLVCLLKTLPEDAEIRVAFAEDPIGCIGTRDLCIYGISDGFGPPGAPDLKAPSGPGVFWIVTSHLIEVKAPARTKRKERVK